MSRDFPSQYGRSDLYRNPNGTLPMPSAQDIPRPLWVGGDVRLSWGTATNIEEGNAAGLPTGFLYTYVWTSPAFDLRPDLRSAQGGPKAGVPIWSSAARMYIQLTGDSAGTGTRVPLSLPNLTVNGTDFVAAVINESDTVGAPAEGINAGLGLRSTGTQDVTSNFGILGATQDRALGGFVPPGTALGFGEGYPVRYWRLRLTFSIIVEAAVPLPVPATAAPNAILRASVY